MPSSLFVCYIVYMLFSLLNKLLHNSTQFFKPGFQVESASFKEPRVKCQVKGSVTCRVECGVV